MRFFTGRPEGLVSLHPLLADRLDKSDGLFWQSVIPAPEPVFAAWVQLLAAALPEPLLQGPAPDNVHKVLALRAEQAVPHLPAGDPGPHQEVVKEVLGPV